MVDFQLWRMSYQSTWQPLYVIVKYMGCITASHHNVESEFLTHFTQLLTVQINNVIKFITTEKLQAVDLEEGSHKKCGMHRICFK